MTMGARPTSMRIPATRLGLGALLVLAILVSAGCAAGTRTTFPPLGSTPGAVGDATAATERQVVDALAAAGLQAVEANRTYRPPEGPLLAAASRSVIQATLPDDPGRGFIVIYALSSAAAAAAAARDHAAYISSPIGRINFPTDSRFVVRVVGSTVIFFHWSPGAATDGRTQLIQDALETVGVEVQVPS